MYAPFAVMFTKAKSCLKTTNAPCAASAPTSSKKKQNNLLNNH